jgi:hypothetical protein
MNKIEPTGQAAIVQAAAANPAMVYPATLNLKVRP